MDVQEAWQQREQVTFLDIREPEEWAVGRIDGSLHIPMMELPARLEEVPADRTIVAVCRVGARSESAARWLRGRGLEAHNLNGGLLAWKVAGHPLHDSAGAEGSLA